MGVRKKKRFISKAFVDSSDESDLDEQSVHMEVREGGDGEEWRVQELTSENSSVDRLGNVQHMQTDIPYVVGLEMSVAHYT